MNSWSTRTFMSLFTMQEKMAFCAKAIVSPAYMFMLWETATRPQIRDNEQLRGFLDQMIADGVIEAFRKDEILAGEVKSSEE